MTRIEPLNVDMHHEVVVGTRPDARHGEARHFVPVVVSEFPKLAAHYPILLAKSAETGAFFVGAMLGIEANENLFLADNGDGQAYRPLELRRRPFYTVGDSLGIDMDHPCVNAPSGERLFDPDREPTPFLRGIQAMVGQLKQGIDRTNAFIQTLIRLRLVEPIDISLRFDDGTHHRLDGLYTVSSDRLSELADDEVLSLFRNDDLRLVHTMIGTLEQIPKLARMHNERLTRSF
ncbi:MAG: SapC family protein [Sphingomonas oligoaromativorans]